MINASESGIPETPKPKNLMKKGKLLVNEGDSVVRFPTIRIVEFMFVVVLNPVAMVLSIPNVRKNIPNSIQYTAINIIRRALDNVNHRLPHL